MSVAELAVRGRHKTVESQSIVELAPRRETQPEPLLLRTSEVARLLSLSRTTIHELVNSGQLPAVRVGRAIRISRAAVERFIEQHQVA